MARPTTDDLPAMEGEGVARKKVKAVETASDNYVEARDNRMALTVKEVEAKIILIAKMKEHGIVEYVYDDHKVILKPGKDNVKVRSIDGDDFEDDDQD